MLGWREAGIVAIAIPVTLALTLTLFYFTGYTLNRITLFALIFSIGILVDDPIVDVENIVRHFRMPQNRGRNLLEVTLEAVHEVRSPLILATLTVVCAARRGALAGRGEGENEDLTTRVYRRALGAVIRSPLRRNWSWSSTPRRQL